MTTLEPAWTRGPYEKQEATVGTPYQPLPVTLPNMMNHVHGARKARRGSGTGCHERAFLPLSSIPPSFSPSLPPSLPRFLLASPPARSFLPLSFLSSLPSSLPPSHQPPWREKCCFVRMRALGERCSEGGAKRTAFAPHRCAIERTASDERRRDGLMLYGPRRRPGLGSGAVQHLAELAALLCHSLDQRRRTCIGINSLEQLHAFL